MDIGVIPLFKISNFNLHHREKPEPLMHPFKTLVVLGPHSRSFSTCCTQFRRV